MKFTDRQREQLVFKGLDEIEISSIENMNFNLSNNVVFNVIIETINNDENITNPEQIYDAVIRALNKLPKTRKISGGKKRTYKRRNTIKKRRNTIKKRRNTIKKRRKFRGGRGFTTSATTNPIAYKEDEYDQFKNMLNYTSN